MHTLCAVHTVCAGNQATWDKTMFDRMAIIRANTSGPRCNAFNRASWLAAILLAREEGYVMAAAELWREYLSLRAAGYMCSPQMHFD